MTIRTSYPLGMTEDWDGDGSTSALLAMIAGDRAATPWVNVKCHGHDSGVQLRFQEDGGQWGITFRRGGPSDVEHGDGGVAEALTVRCDTCGETTRRTVDSVLPQTLRSLSDWSRGGRRYRPATSWTTT